MALFCSGTHPTREYCGSALSRDPELKPDPDIAGGGVILAFTIPCVLSAVISVILAVHDVWSARSTYKPIYLVKPPLPSFGPQTPLSAILNSTDHRRHGRISWVDVLGLLLLSLGDTQHVMGTAIGFALFGKCGISVYHHHIALNLMWLAVVTTSTDRGPPFSISYSAFLARLMRVMLLWNLFVTLVVHEIQNVEYYYGLGHRGLTVRCIQVLHKSQFIGPPWNFKDPWTIAEIFILISFAVANGDKTLALFPSAWIRYRNFLASGFGSFTTFLWETRQLPRGLSAKLPKTPEAYRSLRAAVCLLLFLPFILPVGAAWLVVFIIWHFWGPFALCFRVVYAVLNISSTYTYRADARTRFPPDDKYDEDQWGFGQIVPLATLFWVVMALLGAFEATKYDSIDDIVSSNLGMDVVIPKESKVIFQLAEDSQTIVAIGFRPGDSPQEWPRSCFPDDIFTRLSCTEEDSAVKDTLHAGATNISRPASRTSGGSASEVDTSLHGAVRVGTLDFNRLQGQLENGEFASHNVESKGRDTHFSSVSTGNEDSVEDLIRRPSTYKRKP